MSDISTRHCIKQKRKTGKCPRFDDPLAEAYCIDRMIDLLCLYVKYYVYNYKTCTKETWQLIKENTIEMVQCYLCDENDRKNYTEVFSDLFKETENRNE